LLLLIVDLTTLFQKIVQGRPDASPRAAFVVLSFPTKAAHWENPVNALKRWNLVNMFAKSKNLI
jgi:hypothetical protein